MDSRIGLLSIVCNRLLLSVVALPAVQCVASVFCCVCYVLGFYFKKGRTTICYLLSDFISSIREDKAVSNFTPYQCVVSVIVFSIQRTV